MIKEIKVVTIGTLRENPVKDCCNPEALVDLWHNTVAKAKWFDPEKEAFVSFNLNTKNQVKSWNLVTVGCLDACVVHAREVFRSAVASAAASVIVAHNHPSGDTTPSREDMKMTRRLVEAGKVLGIRVLDSLVIGDAVIAPPGYLSMRENKCVEFE